MTEIISEISQNEQKCSICGGSSNFIIQKDISLRESLCPACGTSQRTCDLAKIILDTFLPKSNFSLRTAVEKLSYLSIFEAQSSGPVHNTLSRLPHYICSEYFDNIERGRKNKDGIMCQDLQNLTFPSNNFDLIITQDVLEHIQEPEKAFIEIRRVLKPGGFHIFTIPYHESRPTLRRIVIENGKKIHMYPEVYHGDPLREQGALVFTDFGSDMSKMIEDLGFSIETIPFTTWYSPKEIPYIADEKEYQTYLNYNTEGNMLKYFKYNSWVFRTKKNRECINNYA
jgi:SAM-dependent methyltransferase